MILRVKSTTKFAIASHEITSLPSHLFARGLTEGKHSDITIHAFGTRYALHRLLLDRAPYFSSMLSGPWSESSKKDVVLDVEDLDSNITQAAFELALRRIYGCNAIDEESSEAIGLFATGCWLEMNDLIESSVNAILGQLAPKTLGSFIRLVTSNYYGSSGDRILASAKAMLCKEGWEMPLRYWDNVSGEVVREVVGNDGFFVHGEWERWVLAKRVFNRRLKLLAIEAGLVEPSGHQVRSPPNTMKFNAIRFDAVYRKSMQLTNRPIPESYDPWLAIYTNPDIAALLVLLDEGIHYVHLSFEQLKQIKEQRDAFGLPLMPEGIISNSLWTQMELRQKVLSANELQQELGLTQSSDFREENVNSTRAAGDESVVTSHSKGKQAGTASSEAQAEDMESGSWDGNGQPRKFWVPNADHTSIVGGNSEPVLSEANTARSYIPRHLSRLSANIDPQDVQWASDFAATGGERPQTPRGSPPETEPISYSLFAPFRFAAEFPNPRSLKEKKRVYSRTVWYAGSYWNVYIQKIETSKNTQLGVYLHRAKDNNDDDPRHSSVDERIGQVELLMRRNQRQRQQQQRSNNETRAEVDEEPGTSSGDPDATLISPSAEASRSSAISSLLRGDPIHKSSQNQLPLSSLPDPTYNISSLSDTDDPYASLDYSFGSSNPTLGSNNSASKKKLPMMPPYVDARPTIRTYFKIFSPSKGGRMIATYESAPDRFNFSQSWGWKSSTMILDDGFPPHEESGNGREGKGNGRLRFMVVIGKNSQARYDAQPPPHCEILNGDQATFERQSRVAMGSYGSRIEVPTLSKSNIDSRSSGVRNLADCGMTS